MALTLAVLSICTYTVSAQSHNVTWGATGPYDILLDSQVVQEKYKFLRVVSEDFTFPTKVISWKNHIKEEYILIN